MDWQDDCTIKIDPPTRPKKITGTRFGAVLGLNVWHTPFEVWCEITRTYEQPFVETGSTLIGKVVEDRQCKFLNATYFPTQKVVKPEDIYGHNFFEKTHGDFYPQEKVFGGMWDALVYENDVPTAVVECKTTRRAEDWVAEDGQIIVPEYYALQGSLYAYLLNLDDVYMIVSVINDSEFQEAQSLLDDYGVDRVEAMVKNGTIKDLISYTPKNDNTTVIHFKVSEKYPNFVRLTREALLWHKQHIENGISPKYDEKKDAVVLKELRKNNINPTTDLSKLLKEEEKLETYLDTYYQRVEEKEERLKNLKGQITDILKQEFREGDKQVVATTTHSTFTLTKSERKTIDSKKLEQDGLLNQYQTITESFTLKRKENKED